MLEQRLPERVLVLGGTGFLGSEIVRAFVRRGSSVVVVARHRPGGWPNSASGDTELVLADAGDPSAIASLVDQVDHVVFSVGAMLPQESNGDPAADLSSALPAVLTLLEALRQRPEVRLTYLSSGGTVYGNPAELPVSETASCRPITSYGIVKRTAEMYIEMYSILHGVEARILRIGNAYGPLQPAGRSQGIIGSFLAAAREGTPVRLFGNGTVVRDYVHVGDVADAAVTLSEQQGGPPIVNVGSGIGHSAVHLLDVVGHVTGAKLKVEHQPERNFDVREIVLDTGVLSSLMKWEPRPLYEGIEQTWHALVNPAALASPG